MKRGFWSLLMVVVLSAVAAGAPIVTVVPSISPNGAPVGVPAYMGGSSYFDQYVAKALTYLAGGAPATNGNPSDYATAYTFLPGDVFTTDGLYYSWRGSASPAGFYANETGNQLMFGVAIQNQDVLNDPKFTLTDVNYYEIFFGNLSAFPITNYVSNFGRPDIIGINNSTSTMYCQGCPGGAGDALTPIDTLYFAGFGAYWIPGTSDPNDLPAYVASVAGLGYGPQAGASYTVFNDQYGGSATASMVPEPSTITLAMLGLAGLGLLHRRRRK